MPDINSSAILQTMRRKPTDELLHIWRGNDRETWSEAAFTAVRALLQERGVELPPQDAAVQGPPAMPEPEADDPEREPIAIGSFVMEMDAQMARVCLEAEGIPTAVIEAYQGGNTAIFGEAGRVRLLVRRGDAERAIGVLREAERAGRRPTELIAAQAPAGRGTEPLSAQAPGGRGTEPEAASAPSGRGTEPEAVESQGQTPPRPAQEGKRRRWWPW